MEMGMMSSTDHSMSSMGHETAHHGMASMHGDHDDEVDVVVAPLTEFGGLACGSFFDNLDDDNFLDGLVGQCTDLLSSIAPPLDAHTDEEVLDYTRGVCDCHPGTISFSLSGGDCNSNTNFQGGKLECSDQGPLNGETSVTSSDADITYDSSSGFYTMAAGGRLGAQTDIQILSVLFRRKIAAISISATPPTAVSGVSAAAPRAAVVMAQTKEATGQNVDGGSSSGDDEKTAWDQLPSPTSSSGVFLYLVGGIALGTVLGVSGRSLFRRDDYHDEYF